MGAAASTATEHRYQLCTDESCDRFPCRVYREGAEDGRRLEHDRAYAEGYEHGYRAGVAACPRPHGKR